MKIFPYQSTRRIVIEPGEYYVTDTQEVISTLLGSCIAACLFDPVNRISGMNHFVLARRTIRTDTLFRDQNPCRYGEFAMELLLGEMLARGAQKLHLRAKCFGGGNVLAVAAKTGCWESVGDENIIFAKNFLQANGIPLLSAALGGCCGRNIHFFGATFSVLVDEIDIGTQRMLTDGLSTCWRAAETI